MTCGALSWHDHHDRRVADFRTAAKALQEDLTYQLRDRRLDDRDNQRLLNKIVVAALGELALRPPETLRRLGQAIVNFTGERSNLSHSEGMSSADES